MELSDAILPEMPKNMEYMNVQPHTPITLPDPQNPSAPNQFLRCPLPVVFNAVSADSLRQFYVSSVPQFRVFVPNVNPIWLG